MAYSLGALSFDDLAGDPVFPADRREVEHSIGRDGVAVFATGRRGEPFTMQSIYAFATFAAAMAACNTYANAFGLTPVNMIIGAVDFSGTMGFVVLEVKTQIESNVIFQSSSRGTIAPAFIVRAEWRLQGVE